NVWASWSPYTEIEFPVLDDIALRYKDKGVRVLAMNRKETGYQIERYLASQPAYNNIERITDVNDFFYAGIDGYAMPETVVYDTDGKIIEHIRGVVTKEQLERILDGILAQE
ncbi:MAG: TlpA disulfide reductase family protein, partial [Patescibacteria group bacterium]